VGQALLPSLDCDRRLLVTLRVRRDD
jgi:hypothetical protein